MKKIIYLFVFIIYLYSCTDKQLPENPVDYFSKSIEITPKNIINLEKYNILKPSSFLVYNDWFIFKDYYKENGCIKALSLDLSKYYSGIYEGNGPLEVVGHTNLLKIGDSVFLDDYNHRRMININISDSGFVLKNKNYLNDMFYCKVAISNNRYLKGAIFSDSVFCRLIDYENKSYSSIPFLKDVNISKYNIQSQNSVYLNTDFIISPSKDKFAWAGNIVSYYGFGRIIDDSLYQDRIYLYSDIKVENNINDAILPMKDHKINVRSSTSSKNYAIFLYSGVDYSNPDKSGQCILFYSWEGEPCFKLLTKEKVVYIQYNPDNNRIYGLSEEPESSLIEYDMNGIID